MIVIVCTCLVLGAIATATLVVIATRPPASTHRSAELPVGDLKASLKLIDRRLAVVERDMLQLIGESQVAGRPEAVRLQLQRKATVLRHLRRHLRELQG